MYSLKYIFERRIFMNQTYLHCIDGETLMTTPLPPIRFTISGLLPQGLHILAGPPKVGKSWLALWLCLQVSKGESVWGFDSRRGSVLYLCLEDSYARIQKRLLDVTDDAPDNLFFSTISAKLREGLEQQIDHFLSMHPDTTLIVIDTLQRIRGNTNDANPYASDYRDLGILKELADQHRIAVLLIHHLRKMNDDDPMNMISGTTGISGATDSNFVLRKSKRSENIATLYCTGRDIEYRELVLEFDAQTHIWKLSPDNSVAEPEPKDEIISSLSVFLNEQLSFSGTATELAAALKPYCQTPPLPNVLMKKIIRYQQELSDAGITLTTRRTHERKEISLQYKRVDCVGNDGRSNTDSVSDLPTQPLQPTQVD